MLREVSSITDWNILSALLGVKNAAVEHIKLDNPLNAYSQEQAIIRAWLEGGKATWALLASALRNSLVGKAAYGNAIAEKYSGEQTQQNYF